MCWDYRHRPQLGYAVLGMELGLHAFQASALSTELVPPAPITVLLFSVLSATHTSQRGASSYGETGAGEDGTPHWRPHCCHGVRTGVLAPDCTWQVSRFRTGCCFLSNARAPTPAPCPGCLGAAVQFLSMWGQRASQPRLPWGGCPLHWAEEGGLTHGRLVSTPLVPLPRPPSTDLLGQRRWHPNSACQTPMS